MKPVLVRKALKASRLPNGNHSRFFRMDRSHRLIGAAIRAGARSQGGTLSEPRQLWMTADRIDRSRIELGEALRDSVGVHGLNMTRKPTVSAAQFASILEGPTSTTETPYVVPVLIFNSNGPGKIIDRRSDRRGSTLPDKNVVQRHRVRSVLMYPDYEQASTLRRSSEIGGVPYYGSEQFISIFDVFESVLQHMPCIGVCETPDVFHNEEGRLDFGDQPEEVAKKLPARIVGRSTTDVTKALTRRPTKHAINLTASRSAKLFAREARYVLQVQAGVRKIMCEGFCEISVDVVGRNDLKARLMGT